MTVLSLSTVQTDDQTRYVTKGLPLKRFNALLERLQNNGLSDADVTTRKHAGLIESLDTYSVQFTPAQALWAFGGSAKLLHNVQAGNVFITTKRFSV